MRNSFLRVLLFCGAALTASIAFGAGERQASEQAARTISFPTGHRETSVLLIEASPPAELRAGQEHHYDVKVTNITDHMALENIRIAARASKGVEIVNIQSAEDQQRQSGGQKGQAGGQASNEQDKGRPPANQQGRQSDQQRQQQQQGQHREWTISRLMPGQSATARLTAIGDEEGVQSHCLSVHYEPMVCMRVNYTKPELSVAKTAPERADVCQPIQFRYAVRNTGSGTTGRITVRDSLPKGWTTQDGKQEVQFDVGTLEANQTREFDVNVMANSTGTFGSRAVAETNEGLKAQSARPTTQIVGANLQVQANGPRVVPVGEAAVYEVTVTNRGEAAAEGTQVQVLRLKDAKTIRANEFGEERDVIESRDLGAIQPGESKSTWFRTASSEAMTVGYTFVASNQCARERNMELAHASRRTEIIALPALLLTTVDTPDPVALARTQCIASPWSTKARRRRRA